MDIRKTTLCALAALVSICSWGWGRNGHDAICYIAECNLNKKALKTVSDYLDGKSIVYYSTWPDEVRTTKEWGYTTKWHVAYYDENDKALLDSRFEGEEGMAPDCLYQVGRIIDRLTDHKNMEKEEVANLIRFLVHWVGDFHCPVHIKYPDYKEHNFKVIYGGKEYKYHSVWDEIMIEDVHHWNYMEYEHQLGNLSRKEVKEIQKGSIVDWGEQAARDCHIIYEWAKAGDELGKDFYLKARPLADRQIQLAGYRLAKILNEIFG